MGYKDVRRGNTQADFNEGASTFLFGEIIIISIITGLATFNWVVFGIILLVLSALTWFRIGAIFLTIILTLCWAIIGFIIGMFLGGVIGGIVFGIIALLSSGGAHLGAVEWMDDMSYR